MLHRQVVRAISSWLSQNGYQNVCTSEGSRPGPDITATAEGDGRRIIIECKGLIRIARAHENLAGVIYQILRRMKNNDGLYAIGLCRQYQSALQTIPNLAWERLSIQVYLVDNDESVVIWDNNNA